MDSSLIVGLLAEEGQRDLATYSIGFEEAKGEKGDEFDPPLERVIGEIYARPR